MCHRKSKAIEKHFLSKFNDVVQRIHIHSHSRKVCIQVLSQNMQRRHKWDSFHLDSSQEDLTLQLKKKTSVT